MGRILVTGGAGYIGSHVLLKLKERGDEVIVIDNLSTGREDMIHYGELIKMDLAETSKLEKIFREKKIDSVIHFAGSIIVPESVEKPAEYYKNNTVNSLSLSELASQNGVKSFLFSSTAAVYGIPKGGKCSEETQVSPLNPYGKSKLMTEWTLEDICKVASMNSVCLRYFNVAGAHGGGLAGQCSPFSTHLIKIACETALGKREKMSLFGDDYDTPDGSCLRDYIHVDDLAQAHVDALYFLEKNQAPEVFNCGYGHGYSVKEVIDVVKKVSGVDFKVEKAPRREGDAPKLIAVTDKIRKTLNWKPQHDDLEYIVKTALDWERKL